MTYRDLFAKPPNVVQGKNPDTDFFFKEHYSIADERESYKKQWVRLEAEKKERREAGFFCSFSLTAFWEGLWRIWEEELLCQRGAEDSKTSLLGGFLYRIFRIPVGHMHSLVSIVWTVGWVEFFRHSCPCYSSNQKMVLVKIDQWPIVDQISSLQLSLKNSTHPSSDGWQKWRKMKNELKKVRRAMV